VRAYKERFVRNFWDELQEKVPGCAYISRAESETDEIYHQQQQPARHHALVRLCLFVNQRHHRQEDRNRTETAC